MRSLYLDVDTFSQTYINNFRDIEPNLIAAKMKRVNDEEINKKLEDMINLYKSMDFSP